MAKKVLVTVWVVEAQISKRPDSFRRRFSENSKRIKVLQSKK